MEENLDPGVTSGAGAWSFLKDFRWAPPPRTVQTWVGAQHLIGAALARHGHDLARLQGWLIESDAQLADLGGDPLRDAWSSFRPLRLSREEDWSDWLAHLIQTSRTGVFWSTALRNKISSGALASPLIVRREWTLPGGYRADLGIRLQAGDSWIHVEVKIGDDDLKKTVGTGEAMRSSVHPAAVHDVLLLPADNKLLWSAVIDDFERSDDGAGKASSLARAVTVIDWHDVARGLRSALCQSGETLSWRVLARVFCGAVEQSLIGLQTIPTEASLETLSLLDVEHLVRYRMAANMMEGDR